MNIQRHESNTNEILISAAATAIEQMKYEFARELGVMIHYHVQMILSVERLQNV